MSWFLGGIGNFSKNYLQQIENFIPAPLLNFSSEKLFLYAGGIRSTCKFKIFPESFQTNWLQVGMGISVDQQRKFLSETDWSQISASRRFDEIKIDGHWILINWDNEKIEFATDRIGLRDFYYCVNNKRGIFFSTRIDWISKFTETQIDFKQFGSRWKLFNQISPESVLKNIERVSGGTFLSVGLIGKKINKKNNPPDIWVSSNEQSIFNFNSALEELIRFPLEKNELSLSFSGGLDSRVIFSSLLNNKKRNWDTHTFGHSGNLDREIAEKICSDFSISNNQINLDIPTPDLFLEELSQYTAVSVVNNSASSFSHLRNYKAIEGEGKIIIDGGFGEIWRREFFNRLLFLGSKHIVNSDAELLANYLRLHRADVFSEEINSLMEKGIVEQLKEILELLPDPRKIGKENWIDLFAVNTRIKNYYSHEQTRLDQIVPSFMPFLQPSLIQNLIALPVKNRKDGKLFRSLIMKNEMRLQKYPLVKGKYVQPFGRGTFASRIMNGFRKKMNGNAAVDEEKNRLILSVAPFIADRINSQDVNECGFYDKKKLNALLTGIKSGKNQKSFDELDWWLSFELFRTQISQRII